MACGQQSTFLHKIDGLGEIKVGLYGVLRLHFLSSDTYKHAVYDFIWLMPYDFTKRVMCLISKEEYIFKIKPFAEMALKNHEHGSARPEADPQCFEYPSLPSNSMLERAIIVSRSQGSDIRCIYSDPRESPEFPCNSSEKCLALACPLRLHLCFVISAQELRPRRRDKCQREIRLVAKLFVLSYLDTN